MADTTQQDTLRKSRELLNLQADTLLKLAQTGAPLNLAQASTEPWKMAMGGLGAGATLVAGAIALTKLFL